jgi:hypothetical protein
MSAILIYKQLSITVCAGLRGTDAAASAAQRKQAQQRQQRLHKLLTACRTVLLTGSNSSSSQQRRYVLRLTSDGTVTPDAEVSTVTLIPVTVW